MDSVFEFLGSISWWLWIIIALAIVAIRDIVQRKHTISHNFPIVGHIRYWLESIGPEFQKSELSFMIFKLIGTLDGFLATTSPVRIRIRNRKFISFFLRS